MGNTIKLSAISYQLSAISYQLSAISYQLSAISYQLSAISYQLSAISYQLSAIENLPCSFSFIQELITLIRAKFARNKFHAYGIGFSHSNVRAQSNFTLSPR
ncbi:hypothetical protein KQ246_10025 [Pseudoalteromonas shioyasakiensis]|nr:hypothetical protein KQ246_10025 [Pseudoalteromonas shioyasakiensis]